jgi:hypothetical protein
MTRRNGTHRQNRNEIRNPPTIRHEAALGKHQHRHDGKDGEEDAELEALDHLRDLNEEVAELGFFRGRAPGHVDLEHVREKGLRDVEGKAAEEDTEHEDLRVTQNFSTDVVWSECRRRRSDAAPHHLQREDTNSPT